MKQSRSFLTVGLILLVAAVLGQILSFLIARESWQAFVNRLPVIISMVAFWGPIIALIAGLIVWGILRLMGFVSLEMIRKESVEENNPAPAIIFVGTLIASLLFLLLVIRP